MSLIPYSNPYLQEVDLEQLVQLRVTSQLARSNPSSSRAMESVLKAQIDARNTSNRLAALQSSSRDHTAEICTWLNTRKDGETKIVAETIGDAGQPGGWFSSGSFERVHLRTTITIS